MPADTALTRKRYAPCCATAAKWRCSIVREEGVFSDEGHPFFANSLPLSRLEMMIRPLVPRYATRVVVYDGGDGADGGLAERAAAKLRGDRLPRCRGDGGRRARLGRGGVRAVHWVNVPSKAFGELVEHRCARRISPRPS